MLQNQFFHPGRGLALRKVAASTGNLPDAPETTTIPDGGYSETFAGHDAIECLLEFVAAAAATGNILVEEVIDSGASVAGETYATIALSAERVGRWNATKPLGGFFRVKNSCGQSITAYLQKRIA